MGNNRMLGRGGGPESTPVVQQENQTNQGGTGQNQPSQERQGVFINRRDVLDVQSTGVRVNERTHRREAGLDSDEAKIPPEIQKQYKHWLTDHVDKLKKIYDRQGRANTFSHLPYDEQLLTRYLMDKNGELDTEKIDAFLQEGRGYAITTALMEEIDLKTLSLQGLDVATVPRGARANAREFQTQLGIDEGVFHKLGANVRRWLGEEGTIGGRHAEGFRGRPRIQRLLAALPAPGLALAGGLAAHNPVAGAAGAAGVVALEAAWRSFRTGVELNAQNNVAAFNAFNNPAQREYLLAMTGIDMNDFHVVGDHVERNPGVDFPTQVDITTKFAEVVGNIYTRMDFYESLGVRSEQLDAMPEQFLTRWYAADRRPEQINTILSQHVQREFRASLALLPAGAPTQEQLIRLYSEARSNVLANSLEDLLNDELDKKEDSEQSGSRDKIIQLLTDVSESGTVVTRLKTEHTDQATVLTGESEKIGRYLEPYSQYREARRAIDLARDEARARYGNVDIQTALNNRIIQLNGDAPGAAFGAPVAGSIPDREAELRWEIQDRVERSIEDDIAALPIDAGGAPDPREVRRITNDRDRRTQVQQDLFSGVARQIESDKARLQADIQELETFQRNVLEKQREIGRSSETLLKIQELTEQLQLDNREIVGWGATAGIAGFDNAYLRTHTIAEIMTQINAANAVNPDLGWPEGQNTWEHHRERIINAVVEARGEDLLNRDPAHTGMTAANFNLATTVDNPGAGVVGWNFTENELLTNTFEELVALNQQRRLNGAIVDDPVHTINPTVVPPVNVLELRNAMSEAQMRLRARESAITQQKRVLKDLASNETRAANDVSGTFENVRLRLTAYDQVGERQDIIYSTIWEDMVNRPERFFNIAPVAAGDPRFTPEEIAAHPLQGYTEILDMLTGYKTKKEVNRGAYFQAANLILNEDDLYNQLVNSEHLFPAGVVLPINLAEVFVDLQTRLAADPPQLNARPLRQAFRDIINTLVQRGAAINPNP